MLASFSLFTACLALTQAFSLVSPVENNQIVNVIVTLRQGTSGVIEQIKLGKFSSREQRHVALVDSLKEHSAATQKPVLDFLNKEKLIKPRLRMESLWMTNQIAIKGADFNLISRLSALPQVSTVEEERFVRLDQPGGFHALRKALEEDSSSSLSSSSSSDDEQCRDCNVKGGNDGGRNRDSQEQQWGVIAIQAPEVWSKGNTGQNVTVCSIGTGARATHEALRDSFIGKYGWYDPVDGTNEPEDPNGIGTHTVGTISGTVRGIGVAPGSKWSACKACGTSGICSTVNILSCAQWVLCPNPDCSQAPRVVNNLWGDAGGNTFFRESLEAWTAAGIIPVFPIGGSGPTCGSAGSPGDSELAIGVAATTVLNSVSAASSSGPGPEGRIKPDLAAPGENILSAFSLSDTSYASFSGSSLASPHVAGLVALILHDHPDATYEQVLSFLTKGAENTVPTNRNCGGIPETQLPNHVVGYGRINALKSISAAGTTRSVY